MGFACVGGAACRPPIVIFSCQCFGQKDEPPVVCDRGADPDRTGVIPVSGSIAVLATVRGDRCGGCFEIGDSGWGGGMMGGPQELRGFQKHFDDVFVAVIAGGDPWVV